jgi:predicted dehydrogenase
MVTVALVGAAHIHVPNFIKTLQTRRDELRVKYVWDHDNQRASRRAGELGAQATQSVDQVFNDKDVAAVVVCSETDRHEPLVLAAAKAKKHLFVEKPLGLGARDAYAMARAIEKAGVIFQTGYFMRGNPIHQFLREQVRLGNFGKITRWRAVNAHGGALKRWFDAEWRWMTEPAQAGFGAFGDMGTHALDIMLWCLGDVQTCTATMNPGTGTYGECDETGEGLLKFRDEAIGSLAAAWDDLANPVSLMVSGTQGLAYVVNGQFYFICDKVAGADGKQPWTQLPPAWPHAFELFLDAITGKGAAQAERPLVTASEAAYNCAVIEALYHGARAGKWVAPKRPALRSRRQRDVEVMPSPSISVPEPGM